MNKTFSLYRVTLLLYVGVLLLPFGFYYTYDYMQKIQEDTQVISTFNQLNMNILSNQQLHHAKTIEQQIVQITPWFTSSAQKEFYVGGRSFKEDFVSFLDAWRGLEKEHSQAHLIDYLRSAKRLNFLLNKMVFLKQNRLTNLFYINIVMSSIFLLLLIYFTRTYIRCQLNKQSIYDKETKLFNQSYFESQLSISCAQAKRTKQPLSLISIKLNIDTPHYQHLSKKAKKDVLEKFGNLILSLTRVSDMACRCDKNNVTIFTPNTKRENALLLKARIEKRLEEEPILQSAQMHFTFTTVQYDCNESTTELLKRMKEDSE